MLPVINGAATAGVALSVTFTLMPVMTGARSGATVMATPPLLLAETLIEAVAVLDAPWLSVTATVSTQGAEAEAGAVHAVEAEDAAAKVPQVAVHA